MQKKLLYSTLVLVMLLASVPTLTFGKDGESSGSGSGSGSGKSSTTELTERKAELAKKAAEALKKAEKAKLKTENLEKRKSTEEQENETESEKDERKTREARLAAGCEKIETKIAAVLTRHETAKQKHLDNQDRLYTRATELSKKLAAAGYNTAKLDADLATFKGKADLVKSTFAAYSASLTATEAYTCGESEGAFKEQLSASKTEYKAFRDALKDAREYWKAVVKVDIKALKDSRDAASSASPSPTATSSASAN